MDSRDDIDYFRQSLLVRQNYHDLLVSVSRWATRNDISMCIFLVTFSHLLK